MTNPERTSAQTSMSRNLNWWADTVAPWHRKGATVHVGRYDKPPAPAWYEILNGDVHIDLAESAIDVPYEKVLADRIASIDPAQLLNRKRRSEADRLVLRIMGLLQHEAAHSKWSTWQPPPGTSRMVAQIMLMFEEVRVERRAMDTGNVFVGVGLRSSMKLIMGNITAEAFRSPVQAAHAWALLVGRVNAGVTTPDEVSAIDIAARIALGDDIVDDLTDLLDEAIFVDADTSYGLARLKEIAEEWLELLKAEDEPGDGEEGGSEGEGEPCEEGEPGEKGKGKGKPKPKEDDDEPGDDEEEGGGGEGDDSEDTEDSDGEDGKGDGDSGSDDEKGDGEDGDGDEEEDDEEGESNYGELGSDRIEIDEESAAVLKEALEKALEEIILKPELPVKLSDPKKMADKVFGSRRHYGTARPPTDPERRAVSKFAHDLETLTIPTITRVVRASTLPPGRLRGREMVRAAAERSRGRMVTATPWETTKRRRTTAPPMTVGIMTDTSGSMRWAEDFVASSAYIVANAAGRVGARTAAITFGDKPRAVVWPGQRPTEVRIHPANGRQEAFDEGAAAMDGILNLSNSTGGAKVMVIVSDGHFVRDGEPERAQRWLERWHQAGVVIVWVAAAHDVYLKDKRLVNIKAGPFAGERSIYGDNPLNSTEMVGIIGSELKRKVVAR